MGTKRLSVPEAAAYRILRLALTDLRKAERALARSIEHTPPDADQAAYLAAIRAAIAKLHLLFASQNCAALTRSQRWSRYPKGDGSIPPAGNTQRPKRQQTSATP
jgi:hypothetical protein